MTVLAFILLIALAFVIVGLAVGASSRRRGGSTHGVADGGDGGHHGHSRSRHDDADDGGGADGGDGGGGGGGGNGGGGD